MSSSSSAPGVVIIGTGWGVNTQLPAFQFAGWKVVAVVAKSDSHAKEVESKCGNVPVVTDLASVLSREDVHLVTITTPPATHHDLSVQVTQAGKHVMTEKPFTLTVRDAEEMRDHARHYPEQLSLVDHELRCLQAVQIIRKHLDPKNYADSLPPLGDLLSMQIAIQGSVHMKPTFNWWSEASAGGGILGAIGTHMFDLIQYVTHSRIHRIQAHLHSMVKERQDEETKEPRKVTSDDYAAIHMLAIPPGKSSQEAFPISMSLIANSSGYNTRSLVITGSKQTIVFTLDNLTVTLYEKDKDEKTGEQRPPRKLIEGADYFDSSQVSLPKNAFTAGTVLLAKELKEIVQRKGELTPGSLATFDTGVEVQMLLECAHKSVKQKGEWIDVPDTAIPDKHSGTNTRRDQHEHKSEHKAR